MCKALLGTFLILFLFFFPSPCILYLFGVTFVGALTDINGRSGTSFASMSANASRAAVLGKRAQRSVDSQTDPYALDFLGDAATFLSNIRPSGRSYSLAVPRAALGAGGLGTLSEIASMSLFIIDS